MEEDEVGAVFVEIRDVLASVVADGVDEDAAESRDVLGALGTSGRMRWWNIWEYWELFASRPGLWDRLRAQARSWSKFAAFNLVRSAILPPPPPVCVSITCPVTFFHGPRCFEICKICLGRRAQSA